MLENELYLILFKNTIFSRIVLLPEIEYALSIMRDSSLYNKKILWLISSLSIELASIVNYLIGLLLFLLFNYFKKIEVTTYLSIKKNCSTLILLLMLLSFYSNGGGIIVLIAGFLRINIKWSLVVTSISSILGFYL